MNPENPPPDPRISAPSALRNRGHILDVLRRHLPPHGLVLEIASGSGEHCVRFAEALPAHTLQPSDPDPQARASIDSWIAASGLRNLRPAVALDATEPAWPLSAADAVVCINMIHIAPWRAAQGLFEGAALLLRPGAPLYLYGPYRRGGTHTAPSNADFDADLRRRNPDWGVRDLETVAELAMTHGFSEPSITPMPANNLSLVFTRLQPPAAG